MLVHGEVVIDVELHHRDDALKLGDKGPQNAKLIHPAQRAFGVAVGLVAAGCVLIAAAVVLTRLRRRRPHRP